MIMYAWVMCVIFAKPIYLISSEKPLKTCQNRVYVPIFPKTNNNLPQFNSRKDGSEAGGQKSEKIKQVL